MRFPNSKALAAVFLLTGACLALEQQTDALGSVAGRVTNSVTGAPVMHAHVRLTLLANSRQEYGALSGADGKFSIGQLPSGQYSFYVDAPGFQSPLPIPGVRPNSLRLGMAEHRDDFDLSLMPYGSVSGRVLDADGQPAQGVEVQALGPEGFTLEVVSDPDGQYRIGNLAAGKYRVRAVPRSLLLPPEIRTDGTIEVRYGATYHPDSLTLESAGSFDVLPGAERSGTDIHLVRIPIVAVRGSVAGTPPGMGSVIIDNRKIEPRRAPNTKRGMMIGFSNQVASDGSFTIWGLAPGRHILTARSNGGGWESAPLEISVGNKDLDGVMLRMMQQFDISGQVASDGTRLPVTPPNASLGQSFQIVLRAVLGDTTHFSVVDPAGNFHLTRVTPGVYSVGVSMGAYVKSMRVGTANVEGSILDLRNGWSAASLTVTASSATAQINGMVRSAAGPVPYARVEMLSDDIPDWEATVAANPQGRYSIPRVPPGKYKLLVLDSGVAYPLAIRDHLADYSDITVSLEIQAGESVTRDLQAHQSTLR